MLNIEDKDYVPIIRNPKTATAETEAVFYFPGCDSERLFSQAGLAKQAMLWHAGVQTVLPPGYLCCGYPRKRSGQFEKIFPASQIIDMHEYLLEKGITLRPENGAGNGYLFYDPCHSPMKPQEPMKTVKAPFGDNVFKNERCCGESVALGVTRPEISTQIRFGKEEKLQKGEGALRELMGNATGGVGAASEKANVKILTTCPSSLQGLSRSQDDMKNGQLEADYIVVEMAGQLLGKEWLQTVVDSANHGGIERALV